MNENSNDSGSAFLGELRRTRVLAIVRGLPPELVVRAALALHAGGIRLFEVTTDSPDWEVSIDRLVISIGRDSGDGQVGAGTVLTLAQAAAAQRRGATFLVSPVASAAVAEFAREASLGYIPGAMTPAEIYSAHSMSATCIKVFPADVLGPRYITRVLQPMAFLRLLPTGGITIEAAGDYLRAGAIGIALGSGLIDIPSLRHGDPEPTREAAARLTQSLPHPQP